MAKPTESIKHWENRWTDYFKSRGFTGNKIVMNGNPYTVFSWALIHRDGRDIGAYNHKINLCIGGLRALLKRK